MQFDSFHNVARRYKLIFFDSFGVLKNYNGIIEGVSTTLKLLQQEGIDYILLTNDASRSPEKLSAYYSALGVNLLPSNKIISSGMLAKHFIDSKIKEGTIVYLGTEDAVSYLDESGHDMLPADEIDFHESKLAAIRAVVFLDDEGFDWKRALNNTVNLLRMRNVPVVVANTDHMYPVSDHHIAIATGGIAEIVEKIVGKHFIHFGKPDVQIFNYAYEYAQQFGSFAKSDILMVGDTLTTDIIGANKFGIDTALVLTGNTIPDQSEFMIKSYGIIPDFICESVAH